MARKTFFSSSLIGGMGTKKQSRVGSSPLLRILISGVLTMAVSATRARSTPIFGVLDTAFHPIGFRGGSSQSQYGKFFSPRSPAKESDPTRQGSSPISSFSAPREAEDVSTKEIIDAFLTRESRNSFIARVYAILGVQLIITACSIVLFGVHPVLSTLLSRSTSVQHQKILASIPLVGLLVSTVAWFRVCISPEARQKSPNKWYWLGIFTFGEALSIGFFTSLFKFQSVLIAMGATAIATISVSAFTILQKNPKHDLSQWGQTLSSWVMILLAYGFIGLFQQIGWIPAGFIPYSSMMYSFFASCLFSAYLAYHTKLIVAGKHSKYRMNEKDYVLGAMALYNDIVNIFMNILQMLGQERD